MRVLITAGSSLSLVVARGTVRHKEVAGVFSSKSVRDFSSNMKPQVEDIVSKTASGRPIALLIGFWGKPKTAKKVMGKYAEWYAERGWDTVFVPSRPWDLFRGPLLRKAAPSMQFDVVHAMSGGSFVAGNYLLGGMPRPRRLVLEGGPMLGHEEEGYKFLRSLPVKMPHAVHWLLVDVLGRFSHWAIEGFTAAKVCERKIGAKLMDGPTLLLNGTADSEVHFPAIEEMVAEAPVKPTVVMFQDGAHNRLKSSDGEKWSASLEEFLK